MTIPSGSECLAKDSKAKDMALMLSAVSLYPAGALAFAYLAPDRMWGQPVLLNLTLGGFSLAVGGPALAMLLAMGLNSLNDSMPAGAARLLRGDMRLCRTLLAVSGGVSMLMGLGTLVGWYYAGKVLPDSLLYPFLGFQSLLYVLLLVTISVLIQRRRREGTMPAGEVGR